MLVGFSSLAQLLCSFVSFLLWVERRSVVVLLLLSFIKSRNLISFLSHPSKRLFLELAFFHYYLVNLPHTSDFSFLDWGKKLSRVMLSWRTPAFLLETKAVLLCHFGTQQPLALWSSWLLWKLVIFGENVSYLSSSWVKKFLHNLNGWRAEINYIITILNVHVCVVFFICKSLRL